jgi:RND family efflux transporter MFP subunit
MSATINPKLNPPSSLLSPPASPTATPSPEMGGMPTLSPLTPASLLPGEKKVPSRRRKRARWWGFMWMALVVVAAFLGFGWFVKWWFFPDIGGSKDISVAVVRGDLVIIVTEHGELASSKTEDIRCQLEGRQNKIVFIVPEGDHVKKDEVVVRLDADELTRDVGKQEAVYKQAKGKADAAKQELEVQKNKAETDKDKADLAWTLAKLDLKKYEEKEFQIDYDDKLGAIKLAERELEDAKEKLKNYEGFVRKGFGVPEQLALKRIEVSQKEANLERDKNKLELLKEYLKDRQMTELKAKARDAKSELDRTILSGAAAVSKAKAEMEAAQETAQVEEASLKRFKKQLGLCEIKSPADGIMVYTHERDWDPSYRIQTGGVVFYQQTLARLPDLTHMEAKVRIHESKVKKVKPGQKAEIRIESQPNILLHGTVTNVATVSESDRPWASNGAKEYLTTVKIEDLPADAGLLPNMTAKVEIKVNHLSDVIMVPVQAVTQRGDQHIAYVKVGSRIQRREVTVGENNDKYIEITDGLAEGEQVMMDARARSSAETKAEEAKNPPATTPREPPPAPSAAPAPNPGR